MMQLAFITIFVALVAAQDPIPQLRVVYSGNKDISDLDLDITSESGEFVFQGSKSKDLEVETENTIINAESEGAIAAAAIIQDNFASGSSAAGYESEHSGDIESGAVTYLKGVLAERAEGFEIDGVDSEYEGATNFEGVKQLGLGPNEQPLLRAGNGLAYAASTDYTGGEDILAQATSFAAEGSGLYDIIDGAVVLQKEYGVTKSRQFGIGEGSSESASDAVSFSDTLGLIVDDGPVAFDATATNLFNRNIGLEDLTALRGWVETTEAPALKLLILKMLDYTV